MGLPILKRIFKGIIYSCFAFAMMVAFIPKMVSAAQITGRSLVIGSSVASASTTYSFTFTVPSDTVIKSADFEACTTASGTCTMPTGFSASSSSLTTQPINLGDASGWSADTGAAGSLRLKNSTNVAAPAGVQTVSFSSVTNPSADNETFFIRISTYSDDAWSTLIDSGTVAASTAGQITVTATVGETLTFTLASATVVLGTLSTSATGSGTSSMSVATNAVSGYSVSYSGTTLSSGLNTITALESASASTMNTKQFGINLMSNTTPAIGSDKSGTGSGLPTIGYDTADLFKFNSGDTIASAAGPTNSNTYTVSYIANIDGSTAPGLYSTVITYTATANF